MIQSRKHVLNSESLVFNMLCCLSYFYSQYNCRPSLYFGLFMPKSVNTTGFEESVIFACINSLLKLTEAADIFALNMCLHYSQTSSLYLACFLLFADDTFIAKI